MYEQQGPFATVYLDTSGDAEDAGKAIELRWRSAREQLSEAGADETTLQIIDEALQEPQRTSGNRGLVIVGNSDGVVFSDELPDRPGDFSDDELATYGPVPALFPYLRMRGTRIPHVIAVVDREGADITTVRATLASKTTEVEGDADLLHKSHTGGGAGSEQRQQNAVEENRKHNAGQVAEEISKRAAAINAEAIVLAGDPQQRQLVRQDIRKGLQPLVVETEAGHRDPNASEESLQQEVSETVGAVVDDRVQSVISDFERERGEHSRATEGWESTVAAVQRGQVETLLRAVPDASERPSTLHIGPSQADIATSESALTDMGVQGVQTAPADSALVRGLAGTDSALVLVDSEKVSLSGGIGAVLRYTEG
ncbi:baeRF2 domain-containing protein [Saccharopolyspora rhizosphaerae]|uniref:baeRF2 domain-containing protein n=1 Tax=Saccharopolyspora rhizosphaerae TaxID=2492662 RepID=UPI001F313253|nr:Vms1/Ankzf1 family peptidyl-tRNA hydrolase [Saccharopolyspora rhizosphaerae]